VEEKGEVVGYHHHPHLGVIPSLKLLSWLLGWWSLIFEVAISKILQTFMSELAFVSRIRLPLPF
jgi:hypothetical protein